MSRLDHLVLATRELDRTVDWVAQTLGVRPAPGGRHPGAGTRNFLLSLGPGHYLEVIGPDPDQPEPAVPRWFLIDVIDRPRLTAWVASSNRLEEDVARAAEHGYDLGPIDARSRTTPEGEVLRWRMTRRRHSDVAIVPTLIDWGTTRHPSATAPGGASLVSFRAEHPDVDRVTTVLAALSLDLELTTGEEPRLFAEISGPAGRLTLS
ncbi:MAG TPA: VOC family protein [Candidatus Limnocylindrales bacterium]|nr:VOC family protein [Candidatus Limnocylindrales bacterium]